MISEISVKTKPSNNKARALFIILVAGAFLLIMLSTFISSYKGIVSALGVILLSLGIVIYNKYILPVYYYDITFDYNSVPILVVRQISGKRQITLARVSLCEIVKIEKEDAKGRMSHKTERDVMRYSYMPTFSPDTSYRLTIDGKNEKAEMLVECSEEFASFLSKYCEESRTDYPVD